jgi:hypothetical protein
MHGAVIQLKTYVSKSHETVSLKRPEDGGYASEGYVSKSHETAH